LAISLKTAIDHGDTIESQLHEANLQLLKEIEERSVIEMILKRTVDNMMFKKMI